MALHQDRNDLTVRQCILEHVPDDEDQRHALPGLVRSRRWLQSLGRHQLARGTGTHWRHGRAHPYWQGSQYHTAIVERGSSTFCMVH
uniref:Uncharacterized protein n=1 Tax=Zea mays TaxID=4577 RepID=C4J031_MAIZE|nr:unknown [Zea mays]